MRHQKIQKKLNSIDPLESKIVVFDTSIVVVVFVVVNVVDIGVGGIGVGGIGVGAMVGHSSSWTENWAGQGWSWNSDPRQNPAESTSDPFIFFEKEKII